MATLPFLPPPGMLGEAPPMVPPPQPSLQPAMVDYREAHPSRPPASQREQAVLQQARERYALRETVEGAWLEHYARDLRYAAGQQWDETVVKTRQAQNRVTVTLNRFKRAEHVIKNEERQQSAGIQFLPVDQGADKETARVYQGLHRHVEYASVARDAYDTAFESLVRGGKGFWRWVTAYETDFDATSAFYQTLQIVRIPDPRCVFLDPTARRDLDYHTAAYGFVVERQRKAFVKERYEITESEWQGWQSQGRQWISTDECLVADYYCKDELPVMLVELAPGLVRYVPRLVATDDEAEQQRQQEVLGVVTSRLARRGIYPVQPEEAALVQRGQGRTRQTFVPVVWWWKINGVAVLEQTLWPGQYIPLVPLLGEEYDLGEGGVDYQGFVRNGIGAQDQFNYACALTLEAIAQGPKNPWIGVAGAFDGHPEWDTANLVPYSKLEYNSVDRYGTPAPPPFRTNAEAAIQATTMLMQQAAATFDDMTGVYPPSWGEASQERSGVAIQQRRSAGSLGSAHLSMNMGRAQCWSAKLFMDVAPAIYQEPDRVIQIVDEDLQPQLVQLQPGRGAPQTQGQAGAPLPEGIAGFYDLTAGRYDVVVKPGPSYETAQQQTSQFLTELAQVSPPVAQLGAHILVGTHGNFKGQDELVRLLKKALPPGMLEADERAKPEERVVVLENQVQQLEQQGQQQQAQLQQVLQVQEQTAQENEKLKLQLQAKHQDYAIDQAELASQREFDAAKLALEREKFLFEQQQWFQEQQWKRYEAEQRQVDAAQEPREDEEGAAWR